MSEEKCKAHLDKEIEKEREPVLLLCEYFYLACLCFESGMDFKGNPMPKLKNMAWGLPKNHTRSSSEQHSAQQARKGGVETSEHPLLNHTMSSTSTAPRTLPPC